MSFTFYHSHLCPRCAQAGRLLTELLGADSTEQPARVDVLRQPIQAWRDGVRMIPALKCDNDILSGVMLSRAAIAAFLSRHNIPTIPGDKR